MVDQQLGDAYKAWANSIAYKGVLPSQRPRQLASQQSMPKYNFAAPYSAPTPVVPTDDSKNFLQSFLELSPVQGVIDVLSRGNFAAASGLEEMAVQKKQMDTNGTGLDVGRWLGAIVDGVEGSNKSTARNVRDTQTGLDALSQQDIAAAGGDVRKALATRRVTIPNEDATTGLVDSTENFIADVFMDPTTYLGVGLLKSMYRGAKLGIDVITGTERTAAVVANEERIAKATADALKEDGALPNELPAGQLSLFDNPVRQLPLYDVTGSTAKSNEEVLGQLGLEFNPAKAAPVADVAPPAPVAAPVAPVAEAAPVAPVDLLPPPAAADVVPEAIPAAPAVPVAPVAPAADLSGLNFNGPSIIPSDSILNPAKAAPVEQPKLFETPYIPAPRFVDKLDNKTTPEQVAQVQQQLEYKKSYDELAQDYALAGSKSDEISVAEKKTTAVARILVKLGVIPSRLLKTPSNKLFVNKADSAVVPNLVNTYFKDIPPEISGPLARGKEPADAYRALLMYNFKKANGEDIAAFKAKGVAEGVYKTNTSKAKIQIDYEAALRDQVDAPLRELLNSRYMTLTELYARIAGDTSLFAKVTGADDKILINPGHVDGVHPDAAIRVPVNFESGGLNLHLPPKLVATADAKGTVLVNLRELIQGIHAKQAYPTQIGRVIGQQIDPAHMEVLKTTFADLGVTNANHIRSLLASKSVDEFAEKVAKYVPAQEVQPAVAAVEDAIKASDLPQTSMADRPVPKVKAVPKTPAQKEADKAVKASEKAQKSLAEAELKLQTAQAEALLNSTIPVNITMPQAIADAQKIVSDGPIPREFQPKNDLVSPEGFDVIPLEMRTANPRLQELEYIAKDVTRATVEKMLKKKATKGSTAIVDDAGQVSYVAATSIKSSKRYTITDQLNTFISFKDKYLHELNTMQKEKGLPPIKLDDTYWDDLYTAFTYLEANIKRQLPADIKIQTPRPIFGEPLKNGDMPFNNYGVDLTKVLEAIAKDTGVTPGQLLGINHAVAKGSADNVSVWLERKAVELQKNHPFASHLFDPGKGVGVKVPGLFTAIGSIDDKFGGLKQALQGERKFVGGKNTYNIGLPILSAVFPTLGRLMGVEKILSEQTAQVIRVEMQSYVEEVVKLSGDTLATRLVAIKEAAVASKAAGADAAMVDAQAALLRLLNDTPPDTSVGVVNKGNTVQHTEETISGKVNPGALHDEMKAAVAEANKIPDNAPVAPTNPKPPVAPVVANGPKPALVASQPPALTPKAAPRAATTPENAQKLADYQDRLTVPTSSFDSPHTWSRVVAGFTDVFSTWSGVRTIHADKQMIMGTARRIASDRKQAYNSFLLRINPTGPQIDAAWSAITKGMDLSSLDKATQETAAWINTRMGNLISTIVIPMKDQAGLTNALRAGMTIDEMNNQLRLLGVKFQFTNTGIVTLADGSVLDLAKDNNWLKSWMLAEPKDFVANSDAVLKKADRAKGLDVIHLMDRIEQSVINVQATRWFWGTMGAEFGSRVRKVNTVTVTRKGVTTTRQEPWKMVKLDGPADNYLAGLYFPPDIAQELVNMSSKLQMPWIPTSNMGQVYDQAMSAWKSGVTIYAPSHHIRNMIGDISFAWFAGVPVWNPRVWRQGTRLIRAHRQWYGDVKKPITDIDQLKGIDSKLADAMYRNYDGTLREPLQNDVLIRVKGNSITNGQLMESAYRRGLLQSAQTVEDLPGREFDLLTRASPFKGRVRNVARGVSESREHYVRLSHYAYQVEKNFKQNLNKVDPATGKKFTPSAAQNKAMDDAAEQVIKWHPDGTDLTHTEQRVGRRLMPFYSWTRKAIPLVLEGIATSPRKITAYPKAQYNLSIGMGQDPESISQPFDNEYFTPNWIREMGVGSVGTNILGGALNRKEAGPEQRFIVNPSNPALDLLTQFGNPLKGAGSSLTPFARVPAELMFGKDLNTGQEIKDDVSGWIDKQLPPVALANRLTGGNLLAGTGANIMAGDLSLGKGKAAEQSGFGDPKAVLNYLLAAGIINVTQYNKQGQFDARDRIRKERLAAVDEAKRNAE